MRMTLDRDADAAYIYFKDISAGEVSETISLNDSINIDIDSEGRTLGIEIINASQTLPFSALENAEIIG